MTTSAMGFECANGAHRPLLQLCCNKFHDYLTPGLMVETFTNDLVLLSLVNLARVSSRIETGLFAYVKEGQVLSLDSGVIRQALLRALAHSQLIPLDLCAEAAAPRAGFEERVVEHIDREREALFKTTFKLFTKDLVPNLGTVDDLGRFRLRLRDDITFLANLQDPAHRKVALQHKERKLVQEIAPSCTVQQVLEGIERHKAFGTPGVYDQYREIGALLAFIDDLELPEMQARKPRPACPTGGDSLTL